MENRQELKCQCSISAVYLSRLTCRSANVESSSFGEWDCSEDHSCWMLWFQAATFKRVLIDFPTSYTQIVTFVQLTTDVAREEYWLKNETCRTSKYSSVYYSLLTVSHFVLWSHFTTWFSCSFVVSSSNTGIKLCYCLHFLASRKRILTHVAYLSSRTSTGHDLNSYPHFIIFFHGYFSTEINLICLANIGHTLQHDLSIHSTLRRIKRKQCFWLFVCVCVSSEQNNTSTQPRLTCSRTTGEGLSFSRSEIAVLMPIHLEVLSVSGWSIGIEVLGKRVWEVFESEISNSRSIHISNPHRQVTGQSRSSFF